METSTQYTICVFAYPELSFKTKWGFSPFITSTNKRIWVYHETHIKSVEVLNFPYIIWVLLAEKLPDLFDLADKFKIPTKRNYLKIHDYLEM